VAWRWLPRRVALARHFEPTLEGIELHALCGVEHCPDVGAGGVEDNPKLPSWPFPEGGDLMTPDAEDAVDRGLLGRGEVEPFEWAPPRLHAAPRTHVCGPDANAPAKRQPRRKGEY
jgi:hypothetical protein